MTPAAGTETVEILPLAPAPLARQPSEPVAHEEHVLRELRLFLRNVTERLILDRRFKAFSKAADTEEVTDLMINEQQQQFCQTNLTLGFCLRHSMVR